MSNTKGPLRDAGVSVRMKIGALWIAVMFLFIYVDHFALFIPGVMGDAMAGTVGGFDVSQGWLVSAMVLMIIPSLMIVLSVVLNARLSRWFNIVVAVVYIGVVIANLIGETWAYYILGSAVEIVLLVLVVGFAWKWPREE